MPVQDLTPQLRTRLSRVERVVGLFVSLATLLLLAGFAYYVYHTGARKGWWKFKARYNTFVESGAGLSPGGDVKLLGFNVGKITEVTAMPPFSEYGAVYVAFYVLDPFQGYVWSDSKVKAVAGDFLGGRVLELIPGGASLKLSSNTVVFPSYNPTNNYVYDDKAGHYFPLEQRPKGYSLIALESPAVTERLEAIANQAQAALPGILDLTNRVNAVLTNVAGLASQAEGLLASARPTLTNVAAITENLKRPDGSLGEWALPTNLHAQLVTTLISAQGLMTNASQTIANTDTNLAQLTEQIGLTLVNLANITSNLNQQVQSNTNILKEISSLIITTDETLQGLKRHWFLRGAFKEDPANKPPPQPKQSRLPAASKAGKRP